MDKLRNIKNRLSVSVDKLSPSRRSKSQQRQLQLGNVPSSESDISESVRSSRGNERPSSAIGVTTTSSVSCTQRESSTVSGSRPCSFYESDMDETLSEECLVVEDLPTAAAKDSRTMANVLDESSSSLTAEQKPMKQSTPTTIQGDSLMSEVMKEVEKISDLGETIKVKRLKNEAGSVSIGASRVEAERSGEDDNSTLRETELSRSEETLVAAEEVEQREKNDGNETSREVPFNTPSACRTESLTSGYFSGSDVALSDSKTIDNKCSKSPLRISENIEQKSAFTSVVTESHSKPVLKREILTSVQTSSESKSQVPISSTVTNTEQNKSAFTSLVSESHSISVLKREISKSIQASSETKGEAPISSSLSNADNETITLHSTPANATSVEGEKSSELETKSVTEKKTNLTKKESLYSRIMRKKDPNKEPIYSKNKTKKDKSEPIYAKIKPKLTAETSFQPIEPIAKKNKWLIKGGNDVVKPEPVYSSVKVSAASSISSPPAAAAAFVLEETKVPDKKNDIYSKIKPRALRSNTIPREPVYSTVKKNSASLPPEFSQSKVKEHIYNTPLPLTPREEALMRRESFYNNASSPDYSKVTVRFGEITPRVPAIITINNPGYAAPCITAPPSTTSPPPPAALASTSEASSSSSSTMISTPSTKPDPLINTPQSKPEEKTDTTPKSDVIAESPKSAESREKEDSTSKPSEYGDRTKLTQLVEELAQELEAVSQQLDTGLGADYKSKKEVLAKLLATYDVPRNLRRVEEADEDAVLVAEQALVPQSVSMDELRYVDDNEDNAETVYADIPDYSQDEFVIALDDINDPRYASLTRALRQQKLGGMDSPGKVSKRSATVYANALNVVTALRVLINSKSSRAASVINKMGTLARPYTQRMQGTITDTSWIQRVIFHKSGHNGFDELRRYIKSGGEFCKELATIMHERAELEASYAKGMYKLSSKLMKASKETTGTITQAWQMVSVEMEQQGDLHRSIASAINDDVVRSLRQLIETQHKIRKGVESMVDKTTKNLHDWRAAETKSKKQSYNNCRENEKIQDMMLEARLGRGKTLTDKETIKMEKQRRKAEEAVQKSDSEYYTCCTRAERARLEWESAVYKGSSCFQTLEEERLQALRDLVIKYHKNAKEAAPKVVAIADRLDEPVKACDLEKDIQAVIAAKGTGENIPEQMLPDFYAEDMNNIMNRDRRREALEKFLKMVRTDLERERRGKQGVENLAKALQETPTFGGEDSQQDVNDKLQHDAYNRLQHMKAMLAYLEAARYKIQCSLDDLQNRPKTVHPLAKHIEVHRDKQGFTCSVLKVPPWVRGNSVDVSPASNSPTGSPNWNDRGTADGNSVQPDSDFGNVNQVTLATQFNDAPPSPPVRARSKTRSPSQANRIDTNEPANTQAYPTDTQAYLTEETQDSSKLNQPPLKSQGVFMLPPRYPSPILVTDEFSSQGSERDYQVTINDENSESGIKDRPYYADSLAPGGSTGTRCKALYDYEANMYDELTIRTGDIINIHEKQSDGWWVGELDNVVGIFPATYVEEID